MTFTFFTYIPQRGLKIFVWKAGFALVFLIFFVSGCTTTSESVHSPSLRNIAMPDPVEEEKSKLENLHYSELLVRGNQYLATNNTRLALLHFQMALKKQNDSADAYAGLGETLIRNGDNRAAHNFLSRALLMDSRHRQALISTGKLCRAERNYEQAEIVFQRVIKMYPADPEIMTELAITYGRAGKEDQAQPLLLQVVELRPHDAAAHNNLGFNYLLQNNNGEAVKTLEEALTIEADNPLIQKNLAVAYALTQQPKKAFSLFLKTGNRATAHNDMGYLYMIMGMKEPARNSFVKALELQPHHYVRAKENLTFLDSEP